MTEKEKLIEILQAKYDHFCDQCGVNKDLHYIENLADFLIAHGVTVQEWHSVNDCMPEDLEENKGKKVINCIVEHDPYGNGKTTTQFRQRKYDSYYKEWHWSKIGGCTVTRWTMMPQPLSIDELRQMIGQPVWVTHRDGSGGRWGIVNEYSGRLCADVESEQAYWFEDYIGTVAYRQRPLVQEASP